MGATTIPLVAEPDETPSGGEDPPDVDDLVAQLRARVEARRRAGDYPAGLEEEMSAHFHRILHLRREPRPLPDIQGPLQAAGRALPLQASRFPVESGLPGGEILHRAIARIVGRQTQGALQQVQAFAQPAHASLEALTEAVQELHRLVQSDIAQSLDALYDRQAALERLLADRRPEAD
jgi:hypothetical protein